MPPNNQTYQSSTQPNKRLIFWVILVLVGLILIFIGFKVYANLTNGKVVVTTNSKDNKITIAPYGATKSSTGKSPVYHNGDSISVKPGTYFVNVANGSVAAAQTVEVSKGQTSNLTINLPASVPPLEPVGDVNASQFVAGKSKLYYIDSKSQNLYSIDRANNVTLVSNLSLSKAQWADSSFGLAEDLAGTLYVINNGRLSQLNMPTNDNTSPPLYAVAPDHIVYLAVDKTIYVSTANGYKKLFTANSKPVKLVAANNRVAILTAADQSTNTPAALIVVNTDGSALQEVNFDNSIGWSPDGKYFFSSLEGPSQVYNAQIKSVTVAPNFLPEAFAWQNDRTVFYAQGNQLWRFDVVTGLATVVATAAPGQTIVNMKINDDGSYLYLSVQSSSGSGSYYSLYRYGLEGQPVADSVVIMHSHLPWLVDGCFLSLVNFSRPTIAVVQSHPYDGCVDVAKNYVQSSGLEPGQFHYLLSNVLPSTPSPN